MSQEILSGLFSQNTFHLIWFEGGVHKYSYILSYSGSPTDLKVLRRKTQDFKDVRVHQSIIRLNCIHISLLLNCSFFSFVSFKSPSLSSPTPNFSGFLFWTSRDSQASIVFLSVGHPYISQNISTILYWVCPICLAIVVRIKTKYICYNLFQTDDKGLHDTVFKQKSRGNLFDNFFKSFCRAQATPFLCWMQDCEIKSFYSTVQP